MFGDPENFDIKTKKEFGLWPRPDLVSRGLAPYVRRMKKDVIISIFDDLKAEATVDFLNLCEEKISYINLYNNFDDEKNQSFFNVMNTNLQGYENRIKTGVFSPKKKSDVVCVCGPATPEQLNEYYASVRSGGIFAGDNHDRPTVKDMLRDFRRANKISIPIQISNRVIWFWRKP